MVEELGPLAATPEPPYYAVIFTSVRNGADAEGYAEAARRMLELASERPGFLGVESVRDALGVGITVSYWASLEEVHAWGRDAEHLAAQARGRARWYESFRLRICRVEQARRFPQA
jgi:heme-degrading monooxygenase HmoA